MSELQRKWAKARLNSSAAHAMAPPPVLPGFDELEEDGFSSASVPNTPQDDDSSSASSLSSTGTVIPSPGRALFARPQGFPGGRSLDPIPWTTYFERELFLPSDDGTVTYHAYLTSPAPPAGPGKTGGPLFVTHHGAGSSGLSFAVLSSEIRKRLPTAGILSLDARGHGLTVTSSSSNSEGNAHTRQTSQGETEDLTLSRLSADLLAVMNLTKRAMHWPALPPIILVGHSLGGAVVTELAASLPLPPTASSSSSTPLNNNNNNNPPPTDSSSSDIDLLGYAVLDVVEGSAMDALQSMQAYLATRPSGFDSLRDAVEWHVRSRTVRNAVSARASVPGLLVKHGVGGSNNTDTDPANSSNNNDTSKEEVVSGSGRGGGAGGSGRRAAARAWRWRTDLAATQPFWEGWFVGLSKKFLSGRGGKLLLLAGTDRLDTELTIGQMQGKYALQVFPEAGHFIHEDLPEKTAVALVDFYRRNDRSALVLPPKVSDLLAQGKKV